MAEKDKLLQKLDSCKAQLNISKDSIFTGQDSLEKGQLSEELKVGKNKKNIKNCVDNTH